MKALEALTPEELVDGFVFPTELSDSEREQANRQLAEERQKNAGDRSITQERYALLLQLRFDLKDYINQTEYNSEKPFSYFLARYVALQPGSKQEFAAEVGIHKSLLSQLLSGSRDPSMPFLVRLELHSRQMIPAVNWFKLLTKQQEHLLRQDDALRVQERIHVRRFIEAPPY